MATKKTHKKRKKYYKPPIDPVKTHELPWTNNYHYPITHFAAREEYTNTMNYSTALFHQFHELWQPEATYEDFIKNWLMGKRDTNMQNKGIQAKPGEDTTRDAAIQRQDQAQQQNKPVKLKDIE